MDKTVTLADQEWQQIMAVLANATGFLTLQKMLGQLQAQDAPPQKGNGPDLSPALRQVPRMGGMGDEH